MNAEEYKRLLAQIFVMASELESLLDEDEDVTAPEAAAVIEEAAEQAAEITAETAMTETIEAPEAAAVVEEAAEPLPEPVIEAESEAEDISPQLPPRARHVWFRKLKFGMENE